MTTRGTTDGSGELATAEMICRHCGARIPADHRFCGQCGAPLADEPLAVEESENGGLPWLELGLIVLFGGVAIALGVFAFTVFRPVFETWGTASSAPDRPISTPAPAPTAPKPAATTAAAVPTAAPTARPQPSPEATRASATPVPTTARAGATATANPTRPSSTPAATGATKALTLRYALWPDRARLVLDLQAASSDPLPYEVLQRDGRVTISLKMGAAPASLRPDDRIVQSVDLTSSGDRAATLDIRVKQPVKVADYILDGPPRLAFDLIP